LRLAADEQDALEHAGRGYHLKVFAEKSENPSAWFTALEGWTVIRSSTMEATRQEERLKVYQDTLVRHLRVRTRSAVPAELEASIRASKDAEQLLAWSDIAVLVDTIEQFRQRTNL